MLSIRSLVLSVMLAACGTSAVAEDHGAPAVAGPAIPEARSFRDWRAVCDNGGDCFAFGRAGPEVTGFVRIYMPAGPGAEPLLSIGAWSADGADAFGLSIDGQTRRVTVPPDEEGSGVGEVRGQPARDLIRAMAGGRTMRLAAGPESGEVSLSGVSAALLWIDERQGRLDTVTALLRGGARPASDVPAPPELPVVRRRPAVISSHGAGYRPTLPGTIAGRPEIAACRDGWGDLPEGGEVLFQDLGPNIEIWGVPCYLAAYNTSHILFLSGRDGANPRPLILDGVDEPVEIFTNVDVGWSITNNVRGRGLGDCGVIQTWAWAVRGFELTSERRMDECWGVPPDLWPTLWRTR